jgi:predicted TIM-barrel fold metal-dependent hydrolase
MLSETVDGISLVDNHAHPVMELPVESFSEEFPLLFTEGDLDPSDARHTVHYRRVLRFLREYFDGDTEAELLARRSAVDLTGYTDELIDQSGTGIILADDGYPDTSPAEFQSYTSAEVYPILRLEPIVEELLSEHNTLEALVDTFEQRVKTALADDYVALKSIAAYRCGLELLHPDEAATAAADRYDSVRGSFDGHLDDRALISHCLHRAGRIAASHGAPVQFHTGFGDRDAHPEYVNPTYLYGYLAAHPETPVVLLHGGYPYVQTAGYVTSTFSNAYLDLSLANPFVQHGVESMFRHALETVPATKLLYGSDAFTTPELYLLAAERARTDLTTVLADLVADGFYTEAYAQEVAEMILRENALGLYNLPE